MGCVKQITQLNKNMYLMKLRIQYSILLLIYAKLAKIFLFIIFHIQ